MLIIYLYVNGIEILYPKRTQIHTHIYYFILDSSSFGSIFMFLVVIMSRLLFF
jgi:hypothetical protein